MSGIEIGRNIVITGLPKSGTTYLAAILHYFSNTIILPEPPLLDMSHHPPGLGVKWLFDHYRAEILTKKPVHSYKKSDGRYITCTRTENKLRLSPWEVHQYDNNDFILGIKSPRPFLYQLPDIIKEMPSARVAVIVRNPFCTAGSLRRFDGGEMIKEWKDMTDIILNNMDDIILVRYQDAVLDPKGTVSKIFGDWDPGNPLFNLEPSEIRYSRDCMKHGDEEKIIELCKDNAIKLGVWDE